MNAQTPAMNLSDVKFDCKYFRTAIPCLPNKQTGVVCPTCNVYEPKGKTILIIKLGALGDVIRTTPLIAYYRNLYPQVHFTWLTLSPDVLPKNDIDVILKYDFTSVYTIERTKFDIAINLDKDPEACMLLAGVSATEKYGYSWGDNQILPATPKAEHKLMTGFFDNLSKVNTKSYLTEIFEICHAEFNYEPYLININRSIADSWKEKIAALTSAPVIGLNTGCGPRWKTRLWSDESWAALATALKAEGFYPVFLGGELEHEKNLRLAEETGGTYFGHFSLEEFIALTDACDVIVTQVSMMMHIATALQKQMVLMNNIFNKHEFELYGRGQIIEPATACTCYFGNTCVRGPESCMHDLHPETVLAGVVSCLART